MASIIMIKGPTPGQRIALEQDKVILGRNSDCGIVLPGNAVSRHHAQVLRIGGQFFLEDLGSRNKTFVNNHPIDGQVLLCDKDNIKICDFVCSFSDRPPQPVTAESTPQVDIPPGGEPTIMTTMDASGIHDSVLESQPAEKLRLLLEITNDLTNSLEIDPLLPRILDHLFGIFRQADRGFVIMGVGPDGKQLAPKAIKTRRERDEINARFSRNIVNQCMQTGQAILSEDASMDERFGLSDSIMDFRIRSVMCAPMRAMSGEVTGVIQLDSQDRSKKFEEDDLKLLVAVGNQSAAALESVQRYQEKLEQDRLTRELQFAKEVQRGFLPGTLPTMHGYEFFAHYESAYDVGGDFYNFVSLSDTRMAVLVGDVAGKGVPAALLMAKLSADARFCLLTRPDPAEAITELNVLIHDGNTGDRFVTFLVAVLDSEKKQMTVVNAGHIPPLIRRAATGEIEEVAAEKMSGLPLGIVPEYPYRSCEVDLAPGDSVLLCSDGVTEAMNSNEEAFGTPRLLALMREAPGNAKSLGEFALKNLQQFVAGQAQHDDITLVCFGKNGS